MSLEFARKTWQNYLMKKRGASNLYKSLKLSNKPRIVKREQVFGEKKRRKMFLKKKKVFKAVLPLVLSKQNKREEEKKILEDSDVFGDFFAFFSTQTKKESLEDDCNTDPIIASVNLGVIERKARDKLEKYFQMQ